MKRSKTVSEDYVGVGVGGYGKKFGFDQHYEHLYSQSLVLKHLTILASC